MSRVALLALAWFVGCDDSIHGGWLVDRTRVLGMRVEAKAEPERASIAPGEPMRLTWLVGAPNGPGHLAWTYAVCPPVSGNFPEPRCEGPVLASGSGAGSGAEVVMELDAPPADALTDLRSLQVLAAFCEGGEPALDAATFDATCSGGGEPLLASGTIRLAAAGPNANPDLVDDAVAFDGATIGASTARAGDACTGDASAPVVVAESKHTLTLRLRGAEREPVPGGDIETILATHVVTAGELARQYSYVEPGDAMPKEISVEWTAPAKGQVPDGGRITAVFIVLRDGRGGAAFARRTLCVRP